MKKLIGVFMVIVLTLVLASCSLDVYDDTNDDKYIQVSTFYEIDEVDGSIIKVYYYVQETTFYTLDPNDIEVVDTTQTLSYKLRGNLRFDLKDESYLEVYALKQREWVNIPETAWYETENKLSSDVLVEYGTIPVISQDYEIGIVVRVHYLDNGLFSHYMVSRVSNLRYIRYGDIRAFLV